jgi:hypothetical protein
MSNTSVRFFPTIILLALIMLGTLSPRAVAWQLTPVAAPQVPRASQPGEPTESNEANVHEESALVKVHGERKCWHNVMVSLSGPWASEQDTAPNPFVDYSMVVRFRHESGTPDYFVLGYFACDGNAAESSATKGNIWRAHLSPDKAGRWSYEILFRSGPGVAFDFDSGVPQSPFDGLRGEFTVAPSDKKGKDLRAQGRLQYVKKRYLKFSESGRTFLKLGVEPELALLASSDFDDDSAADDAGLRFQAADTAHVSDWQSGDPTWKQVKGKALIGTMNFLESSGLNSVSFSTYEPNRDQGGVWPFVLPDQRFTYDCSKLDQWAIVFEHATTRGICIQLKLQENMDGGKLGPERMLYFQQMIARFGHHAAVHWNLEQLDTQTVDDLTAMAAYIREIDPYRHPIFLRVQLNDARDRYVSFLGDKNAMSGVVLHNSWDSIHREVFRLVDDSREAKHHWVVETRTPETNAMAVDGEESPSENLREGELIKQGSLDENLRRYAFWGNLMAGGAGVILPFDNRHRNEQAKREGFRMGEAQWLSGRLAVAFFRDQKIPLAEMVCVDELINNEKHGNNGFAMAQPGKLYLIYLPSARATPARLKLRDVAGEFDVSWFNPRIGGELQAGSVVSIKAGDWVDLGLPPESIATAREEAPGDDWLVVVKRKS